MEDWEYGFINLVGDLVEVLPGEMTQEQLVHLRAYIGRELSRRTEEENEPDGAA